MSLLLDEYAAHRLVGRYGYRPIDAGDFHFRPAWLAIIGHPPDEAGMVNEANAIALGLPAEFGVSPHTTLSRMAEMDADT